MQVISRSAASKSERDVALKYPEKSKSERDVALKDSKNQVSDLCGLASRVQSLQVAPQ